MAIISSKSSLLRQSLCPYKQSLCLCPRKVFSKTSLKKLPKGKYQIVQSCLNPNVENQTGFSDQFKDAVDRFINSKKIVVFMKGNRDFPQCGFSNTVVQILNQMSVPYETVDVLSDNLIREGMKVYSQWPTFPQVYIDGEFYGGCDIMIQGYEDGTLKEELERVMLS
eukprot:TRINITY_DN3045_c0_g1_i1.p1 TRINITY_DN3045_c0_g1~~TRINITY_DN3045_c0_g1_i1.p1  ORF type:complete len:167 (+),score=9.96 TRINITY_DN3045_c0_g1_i1:149-649(+)